MASANPVPARSSSSIPAALTHLAHAAAALGGWLTDRNRPAQRRRRALAVDGKTLRGARRAGRLVHLLAVMDHATRAVLAQHQVNGAPGGSRVRAPAGRPRLAGAVLIADALQTHHAAAEFLVTRKHAAYLFTVKADQPNLLDRCARLAWHHLPVLDRSRDRGHGRVELRTLKAVPVRGFGFPHAAQVLHHHTRPASPASPTCSAATGEMSRQQRAAMAAELRPCSRTQDQGVRRWRG
jgi:hypothetical protein